MNVDCFIKRVKMLCSKRNVLLSIALLIFWFICWSFYWPEYEYSVDFDSSENIWGVNIDKSCSYIVLLHFQDSPELREEFVKTFGDSFTTSLPSEVEVIIAQSEGLVVFKGIINENEHGIASATKQYNGYKFELGNTALESGQHGVLIKINDKNESLNQFKPGLTIAADPKATCG